jgi:hypothetical protein
MRYAVERFNVHAGDTRMFAQSLLDELNARATGSPPNRNGERFYGVPRRPCGTQLIQTESIQSQTQALSPDRRRATWRIHRSAATSMTSDEMLDGSACPWPHASRLRSLLQPMLNLK